MSLYVDSSALLKRYVAEPDSAAADEWLRSDPQLVTGRHTVIEARRNLARLVSQRELSRAKEALSADLEAFILVELDAVTCERAAAVAEVTGVRTLDALHLAAAQRAGGTEITMLTFDVRQAQAARGLGMQVVGA